MKNYEAGFKTSKEMYGDGNYIGHVEFWIKNLEAKPLILKSLRIFIKDTDDLILDWDGEYVPDNEKTIIHDETMSFEFNIDNSLDLDYKINFQE